MIVSCNKDYQDTFYIIPRYIRHLHGMTLAYLDIYETIFQFWNKNKTCFLGEDALCERTGYKRAVIYKALSFFESHNELKRVKKNGKRYLIKPEKIIETDCSEIEPTSTAVDLNVYERRLSTSTAVDHNIKNINKEININPPTPLKGGKKEKDTLSLDDLKKSNPHNIPEQSLKDWLTNRKSKRAPVTKTAWSRLQSTLAKIEKEVGISPIEAFDEMVANGWQSLKPDYFKERKGKSYSHPDYDDDDTSWIEEI